jgi:lipid-A-disaccharide synthase
MRIAIAAGESSGDALGAGLMQALAERVPAAQFFGIAGPRMRAAGCDAWYRSEELSVMGLAEVLRHLPRLLRLRKTFAERLLAEPPDLFVGIDSPDFNLPLAAKLKAAGIVTAQYVSPQVWAWRQSRVAHIARAVDLVLCVLPFETEFYAKHGVAARFVGHPLADDIPLRVDQGEARDALGIDRAATVLALLPGSRRAEVTRLAAPFLATAEWLASRIAPFEVIVAIAHDGLLAEWNAAAGSGGRLEPRCYVGRAREVMSAADVVLTASGTASLEAMLLKKPMVVAYRMSALSYWVLGHMGIRKLPHYSLPNLLAGRALVPEHVQGEVRPDVLGPALIDSLEQASSDRDRFDTQTEIHERLRGGGSGAAADALLGLVASRGIVS